jgi:uncharacterized membrane protein YwzB
MVPNIEWISEHLNVGRGQINSEDEQQPDRWFQCLNGARMSQHQPTTSSTYMDIQVPFTLTTVEVWSLNAVSFRKLFDCDQAVSARLVACLLLVVRAACFLLLASCFLLIAYCLLLTADGDVTPPAPISPLRHCPRGCGGTGLGLGQFT